MLPPPVPTSSFSRHRPVRSKAASGGHRRGAAHGLFEKQGASREFASSAWKPRWCAELPQTPKDKKDCADKTYAELVAAVGAAPSIDSALSKSGSLTKFGLDFWDGFHSAGPNGTTAASLSWSATSLFTKIIPYPYNWFNPFTIGRAAAGIGNILQNPSDPVSEATQAHNAVDDKAIADYKAKVKGCQ